MLSGPVTIRGPICGSNQSIRRSLGRTYKAHLCLNGSKVVVLGFLFFPSFFLFHDLHMFYSQAPARASPDCYPEVPAQSAHRYLVHCFHVGRRFHQKPGLAHVRRKENSSVHRLHGVDPPSPLPFSRLPSLYQHYFCINIVSQSIWQVRQTRGQGNTQD